MPDRLCEAAREFFIEAPHDRRSPLSANLAHAFGEAGTLRLCPLPLCVRFVERLREISGGLGWTLTDLAIAWTLRRPELTSAIAGARSPQQIQQTYTAGLRTLASDAVSAVERAIEERTVQLESVGGAAKPRV